METVDEGSTPSVPANSLTFLVGYDIIYLETRKGMVIKKCAYVKKIPKRGKIIIL